MVLDCGEIGDETMEHCKNRKPTKQKSYPLQVKLLKTIRKELGHKQRDIDVTKIDVESSEYGFLYSMFNDYVCPNFIKQLTLEWHHYPIDVRFGEGSSPHINQLTVMLHSCGLKAFCTNSNTGWKYPDNIFHDLGIYEMRYNLQSFHREGETTMTH